MDFFQQPWNLFSSFFIKMKSMAAYFLMCAGLCLANVSKSIILFAITWTSTSLCPGLSPDGANSAQTFRWCWGAKPGRSWRQRQSCCYDGVGQGVAAVQLLPGYVAQQARLGAFEIVHYLHELKLYLLFCNFYCWE